MMLDSLHSSLPHASLAGECAAATGLQSSDVTGNKVEINAYAEGLVQEVLWMSQAVEQSVADTVSENIRGLRDYQAQIDNAPAEANAASSAATCVMPDDEGRASAHKRRGTTCQSPRRKKIKQSARSPVSVEVTCTRYMPESLCMHAAPPCLLAGVQGAVLRERHQSQPSHCVFPWWPELGHH